MHTKVVLRAAKFVLITKKDPAPLPEAVDPDPDSPRVMTSLSVKIPSLLADMMSGSEAITHKGLMARLFQSNPSAPKKFELEISFLHRS